MAEHRIDVSVKSEAEAGDAGEATKQLRALAGVAKLLGPEMRRAAGVFNSLLHTTSVFNGSLGTIAAAGGGIALAKTALRAFADAVDEARKALEDFAKTGEEITDENRGKSTKELPQLYKERETLQKQLKTQSQIVMEAGNALPSTNMGAAWDWLKGTNVGSLFGAESAKKNYEDVKAQREYTKQQLKAVNGLISRLETQKKKEDKAAAAELPKVETKTVNFMDNMSKMGLYMTGGFAAGQGSVEVQVLKEQKDILKKIEKNTENTTATYS